MSTLLALPDPAADPFHDSRASFDKIVGLMSDDTNLSLSHGELEKLLDSEGRDLIRQLLQDHLELRAAKEPRVEVRDAKGVGRPSVEPDHRRRLGTLFGDVEVSRKAYRWRDHPNLHPADGILNLPPTKYSHGVRALAAIEAAQGSYDSVAAALERRTGQRIGQRQIEEMVRYSAVDMDAFYRNKARELCPADALLVISCDGKGVTMLPDSLREPTRRAAEREQHKLTTRLSKGEKANRKRMAEVGCVYDAVPVVRTPTDIVRPRDPGEARPAPKARAKWVTASVVDDAATVIARIFDEAERRDPEHQRTWIALVDGNQHQIKRIRSEAKRRNIRVGILIDIVHVLEYLWKAAWVFHGEGEPAAERWVHQKLLAVLEGDAGLVAAAIRRTATRRGITGKRRQPADVCANYLNNNALYLAYPGALASGWPIATGAIEGACRHIVKDRMDITGARWGLEGAEAVLKLRAVLANGDFDDYWGFHCHQEQQRNHASRFAANSIPRGR